MKMGSGKGKGPVTKIKATSTGKTSKIGGISTPFTNRVMGGKGR